MSANPYTPPTAKVADIGTDEVQPIRMWSASGRIGRLRYLAYSFGASLVIGVLAGGATAVAGPTVGGVITLIAYIPLIVFGILIAIQRSHDMDWSGWMILLMIIPFAGLIWLFKGGSEGVNRFGAPPPPNTTGVKILAAITPAIVIIGILAAIALPAYQQYQERARAAEGYRQQSESSEYADDEESAADNAEDTADAAASETPTP